MKILLRLISIVFIVSVLWVLIQNIDYSVDITVFEQNFTNVRLPLVLLVAFGVGLIMGALLLALIALQYKAELMKQRKREKKLMQELDSLRNLSIDDISIDELDSEQGKTIDLPLLDKDLNQEESGVE